MPAHEPLDASDPLASLLPGSRQLLQLSTDLGGKQRAADGDDAHKMRQLASGADAQSMLMMTSLEFLSQKSAQNGQREHRLANGHHTDDDDIRNV